MVGHQNPFLTEIALTGALDRLVDEQDPHLAPVQFPGSTSKHSFGPLRLVNSFRAGVLGAAR